MTGTYTRTNAYASSERKKREHLKRYIADIVLLSRHFTIPNSTSNSAGMTTTDQVIYKQQKAIKKII